MTVPIVIYSNLAFWNSWSYILLGSLAESTTDTYAVSPLGWGGFPADSWTPKEQCHLMFLVRHPWFGNFVHYMRCAGSIWREHESRSVPRFIASLERPIIHSLPVCRNFKSLQNMGCSLPTIKLVGNELRRAIRYPNESASHPGPLEREVSQ